MRNTILLDNEVPISAERLAIRLELFLSQAKHMKVKAGSAAAKALADKAAAEWVDNELRSVREFEEKVNCSRF